MGEIRFVGTGETRGYPYLVYKKSYCTTPSEDVCIGGSIDVSKMLMFKFFYI